MRKRVLIIAMAFVVLHLFDLSSQLSGTIKTTTAFQILSVILILSPVLRPVKKSEKCLCLTFIFDGLGKTMMTITTILQE
jgi:hypothetical protein